MHCATKMMPKQLIRREHSDVETCTMVVRAGDSAHSLSSLSDGSTPLRRLGRYSKIGLVAQAPCSATRQAEVASIPVS
jgi:hypothetical protein